jgi:hypothetical protein
MRDLNDQDKPLGVIDRVDDAVAALADTVAVIVARELLAAWRSRFVCQGLNPSDYPPTIRLPANRLNLLYR